MNILTQQKINELFESRIVFYSMDILKNKLSLELELLENGIITNHNVEFLDVSTFYFVNNSTDKRKNISLPEEDDYLELTSIHLSNGIINITLDCSDESWLKQYNGHGNVVLEIWSKLVIVEADKIKINNRLYYLC